MNIAPIQKRSRSRRVGHTFDRPYVCDHHGCHKAFTRNEHLQRHALNHRVTPKWACAECNMSFSRRDLWQCHRNSAHSLESEYRPIENRDARSDHVANSCSVPNDTSSMPPPNTARVEDISIDNDFMDLFGYHQDLTTQSLGPDDSHIPLTTTDDSEWLLDSTFQPGHEVDHGSGILDLNRNHTQLAPNTTQDTLPSGVPLQDHYGEEAPHQLAWAAITLGWVLLEQEEPNAELIKASRIIQRAIRSSIMTAIATSASPALWVVQTLFLVLLFARYHGETDEFGTASILHGVLVGLVQRLDWSQASSELSDVDPYTLTYEHWYKWIKAESLKRIVFQTFVLDVQQTVLFGGNSSMSPFEIDLNLPWGVSVWTADSLAEWRISMRDSPQKPPVFLKMLQQFWNLPSSSGRSIHIAANPGDARVILHGVVSIASETWRQQRYAYISKPSGSIHSLRARIMTSFENWMIWWNGDARQFYVEEFTWRTCQCFCRLAHTLCELSSADLQIAAGATEIEGKRTRPDDFAKARQRIACWASTRAASVAASEAARVVQNRFDITIDSHHHCHHCNWSLYLAGLVLWNFTSAEQTATAGIDQCFPTPGVGSTLARMATTEFGLYSQISNLDVLEVMTSIVVLLKKSPGGMIEKAITVLEKVAAPPLMAL
ncbi:hypothetical protein D6D04_04711 [Aureobasidium pullulans]|nr:hypothetical protein D6D04_04711 [Aureobasidium pullulans]